MLQTSSTTTPPRGALAALGGAYFTLAVASLSVVGLLGPMAQGLSVSKSAIAYLVTAFALTYAVAAPALQMLVGHLDRRTLILTGLCAIAAGAVVNAAADTYEVTLAGRFIMAVGASVVGPMSSAAGAALVPPERRGAALGAVFAGLTIASVIGVPLTAFSGAMIGWRATLVLIAAVALAIALAVAATVPRGSRGVRASFGAVTGTLGDRMLGPALLVTLFQMAGQFTTYAVITAYTVARFGIDESMVPLVLFLYGIGGIVGNVIATRLVDMIGPDRLILTSLVSTAVLFLVIQFLPADPWTGIPLFFFWSVAGMLLYAPQQARLVGLAPQAGNLLLALNASGLYLGMAGGALLSGVLYDMSGPRHLALGSAVLMLMATGAFIHSRRAVRRG